MRNVAFREYDLVLESLLDKFVRRQRLLEKSIYLLKAIFRIKELLKSLLLIFLVI